MCVRSFGPVCPQLLPRSLLANSSHALRYMVPGRLEYMRRLVPHLEEQSEDCLYLNIYAPKQGKTDREGDTLLGRYRLQRDISSHGNGFEYYLSSKI